MKNLSKKRQKIDLKKIDPAVKNISVSSPRSETKGSFEKIEVDESLPVAKKRNFKKFFIPLMVLLILVVGATVSVVIPVQATISKARELEVSGRELADALKNQDLALAKEKLPQTREKLEATRNAWNGVFLLRVLPFVNQYHQDGLRGLNAAGYGLDALDITIATIEPYSDLLGLKGDANFVAGSADERIQLAVQTLDKVTPKIAEIGEKIELLKNELDGIDPNRYPESIQGKPLRSRIVDAKTLIDNTTGLFLDARPLLEVLPQLLGQPDEKRYLVLFQNDKELRPTGGFMTAYAIFKVQQGKFVVEKSDDIYELDDRISPKVPAPEEILTYHKGVYYFNIRDSNLSPDFHTSMQQFEELYPEEFDFDGIVAVDTHVLVEAIKILGDFTVKGRTFSAEIDERCDCPKVIYELEDYSTRPVAYVREDRKDVLGDLLLQIMKKALGVSPSQYWGQLFQMGVSEINQKHILAYMKDDQAQKGVESLNMAGRIADGVEILGYKDGGTWDYLHINDANMAGAKSNLFVEHAITQEYTVESDGSIIKTITIDYKNPAPPSDCNLESGGLCLNGILRNWLRVYVPKGSTLIEGKGSQSPKDESGNDFLVKEDLGKTVFEGFFTVRPLGSAQVVLKYKLPFKKEGNSLTTLVQKQPGTEGHEMTIVVNGKPREKFDLLTDKVITVKL